MLAPHVKDDLRERLTYDTPFWAGGIRRGSAGEVIRPGPSDFQGVAKIVDKARRIVPLIASPWQLELDDALEDQRARGLPMRAIVLKARQLGFSTWTEAKIGQRLTMLEYQRAAIIAHNVDTAGSIFNITTTIHSHLPTEQQLGLGIDIKPAITGQSFSPNGRKFVSFGEVSRRLRQAGRDAESLLTIDTAESPESLRGQTINLLHLSEFAKWPERATQGKDSKMASALNAVPYLPETLVVLEFTANGLNHAHKRWVSAKEGIGDPMSGETYAPIFVPWWRDPAYTIQFASETMREQFVTGIGNKDVTPYYEKEEMYREVLRLTPEQLLWRRMQIRTQHGESVELFEQEYPATDEEAFIGSGASVFPGILVARAIKVAEEAPAPVTGTLRASEFKTHRSRGGSIEIPVGAVWVPADQALPDELLLKVWEHPRTEGEERPVAPVEASLDLRDAAAVAEARRAQREAERQAALEAGPGQYIVGADFSEGQSNTISVGDYHAFHVIDHVRKLQVAEYEGRHDLNKIPLWLVLVGLYFNGAMLAPERNGPGIYVVEALKDLRYPSVYRPRRPGDQQSQPTKRLGWETTQQTKPIMEGTFLEGLSDGSHGVRSVPMARQMNTYVEDERGRHGAMPGEHDDLLMAAMIARHLAVTQVPMLPRKRDQWRPEDPVTGY